MVLGVLKSVKRLKLRQSKFRRHWAFRTAVVKGESVALTILSRLRSIFFLMAFLNSSISFLISLEDLSSIHLEL